MTTILEGYSNSMSILWGGNNFFTDSQQSIGLVCDQNGTPSPKHNLSTVP